MALSDPQTITINAIAQTLARTGFGTNTGVLQKDDGSVKLSISHAYGKRTRRAVRMDVSKTAADVMDSSLMVPFSSSFTLVVDSPKAGYTNTELHQALTGLLTYLTASSGAVLTKVLGGEV